MKNLIPRYTFYKNKYGSELLIDVVELKYVKKFLSQSSAEEKFIRSAIVVKDNSFCRSKRVIS